MENQSEYDMLGMDDNIHVAARKKTYIVSNISICSSQN